MAVRRWLCRPSHAARENYMGPVPADRDTIFPPFSFPFSFLVDVVFNGRETQIALVAEPIGYRIYWISPSFIRTDRCCFTLPVLYPNNKSSCYIPQLSC